MKAYTSALDEVEMKMEFVDEESKPRAPQSEIERQERGHIPSKEDLRELDLDVAEKVMGFDRLTARVDPMNRAGEPQYHMGYPHGHDFAPFYSTDIAAAMQVVEKMERRVEIVYVPNTALPWMVWLRDSERTFAETLPEAICRAALAAVAEKGSE
jgi:hypothetical protein